jgi:Methylamine utilisation protein MauE
VIGLVGTALAGLVALVLSTAAFFKLGDRSGALGNFVAMGFVRDSSSRKATLLFAAVVGAELVVAVTLVVMPPVGAVLGLSLLVVFTAVLARTARTRPTVRCACFGSASQRPIGLSTFVRNALLMLALLPAIAQFGSDQTWWPRWELGSVFVGLGAALVGLLVIQLTMLLEDSRAMPLSVPSPSTAASPSSTSTSTSTSTLAQTRA